MLLFLDVISPLPEFFVIEDNKLILQRKIIQNSDDKLSDNIIQTYNKINNDLNLTKNLKKISATIGPGSYTSLRVGAAFMSAINISKNLMFCPITIVDIIKFQSKHFQLQDLAVFISSANNQEFICYVNKNEELRCEKIENNEYGIPANIKTIFYNNRKINITLNNTKLIKFYFIEEILKNINKLKFFKNTVIKPIYISNNKILN